MGYEAVRGTGRRGRKLGGHTVRGYGRFTDRPVPRPRRQSIYFHGHRSGSADPILMVGALVLGGVVFLLVVLAATHAHAPRRPNDVTPGQPTPTAPAVEPQPLRPTVAPPQSCYPFQPSCP
ncbi:hypothetical protein [Nocardia sputorum]|uniref:hypothetical protein n=1 Tax=Nocardia sputorum TaxID=2984338 RepID=UPI002491F099|nr:hypothetical protein [Nocardia sputorum]